MAFFSTAMIAVISGYTLCVVYGDEAFRTIFALIRIIKLAPFSFDQRERRNSEKQTFDKPDQADFFRKRGFRKCQKFL